MLERPLPHRPGVMTACSWQRQVTWSMQPARSFSTGRGTCKAPSRSIIGSWSGSSPMLFGSAPVLHWKFNWLRGWSIYRTSDDDICKQTERTSFYQIQWDNYTWKTQTASNRRLPTDRRLTSGYRWRRRCTPAWRRWRRRWRTSHITKAVSITVPSLTETKPVVTDKVNYKILYTEAIVVTAVN